MSNLIDTHAHLDEKNLYKNIDNLVEKAKKKGVNKIITIGVNLKSSEKSIEIAREYEGIYASVGIHPHSAKKAPEGYIDRLKEMTSERKVVALGEMGLDYFKNYSPKQDQIRVFREQLSLAKELDIPVIIHDREAHNEVIDILKEYKGAKVLFHCFSGDWNVASKLLDMGFYISFTGTVTYKKAEKLREVLRKAPLDRIMIETDCPHLTPEPFRGKQNEPAYVRLVGEAVAEERGVHFDKIADITTQNALDFFKGIK